ncbi:histone H1.5-like [Heterodontus francisci]|uniref:histone H1.5-like n=1 Tax=Heterodontus francisci TaxID=7792 RepID=UPI00355BA136
MTVTAAAETAPPAAVAQVKTPKKKKAAPRNKSTGPTLSEKILKIVADCTDRRGTSLPAIKKALGRSGVDVGKFRTQIKQSIRRNVNKGSLVQSSGTGASGSFKIPKKGTKGNVGRKVMSGAAKKNFSEESSWKESDSREISSQEITIQETSSQEIGSEESSRQKSDLQEGGNAKEIPSE